MNKKNFLTHMHSTIEYKHNNDFILGEINIKKLKYHLKYFVHKYLDSNVYFSINGIDFLLFLSGAYKNGVSRKYNLNWNINSKEQFEKKTLLIKKIIEITKS